MTKSAVLHGFAESLVDWLTEHGQSEGARIALLAAESAAEPFHYEGKLVMKAGL